MFLAVLDRSGQRVDGELASRLPLRAGFAPPGVHETYRDEDEQKVVAKSKNEEELGRQLQSEDPGLEVVHPHAAGIDVGNSAHYVAVRPDRDPQPVRRFECFTADLYRSADWLHSCGVKTVALQSTGVYWIPL